VHLGLGGKSAAVRLVCNSSIAQPNTYDSRCNNIGGADYSPRAADNFQSRVRGFYSTRRIKR
jgi:hypothetical protein